MKPIIQRLLLVTLLLTTLTSCEVIGDIFKAGMFVGVFVIVLIVVLLLWIIRKVRR